MDLTKLSNDDLEVALYLIENGRDQEAQELFGNTPQPKPDQKSGVPYGVQAGINFLRGVGDTYQNVVGNLTRLGGTDEAKQNLQQFEQQQDAMYDQVAPDAQGWRTGGEVAAGMLAGGSSGLVKGGMKAGERIGTLAAEGGMFGGIARAEDGGELARNVAKGTAIGGAIPGVTTTLAKVYRGIPGVVNRVAPVDDASRYADAFAQQRKVPIMGEDVVASPIVRGSGRTLDTLDISNTRRTALNRYQSAMQDEFGDAELEPMMKELGEQFTNTYKGLQTKKRELYKNAYKSTNALGDVPVEGFQNRMLDLYQKQVDTFGKDSPGAKEVEKWFDYTDGNVEMWHDRLKGVSRRMRKAERSADPDTVDAKVLGEIKTAILGSIEDHAGKNNEWQTAQDFYKKAIVPYREDSFKKLIRKGDTERAALEAVDPAKSRQLNSKADAYWGSLDHEGRQVYKETLMAKMMDVGKDQEIGFSPAKTSSYLDATESRLAEKYIRKDERAALDGWQNLLRVSQFAGEQAARSRTGSSVLQSGAFPLGGGGVGFAVGGIPGAVIGALTPAMPALIVRSRKVRNMLAKLSKMDTKHPDYSSLARDIVEEAGVAGAVSGATE